MVAHFRGAIDLGQAGIEIGVLRDRTTVPLAHRHAVAVQVQPGRTPRPDLVCRYRIRRIEVVGHVNDRPDAGGKTLEFEDLAVGQNATRRDADALSEFPDFATVAGVACSQFPGQLLELLRTCFEGNVALCHHAR